MHRRATIAVWALFWILWKVRSQSMRLIINHSGPGAAEAGAAEAGNWGNYLIRKAGLTLS